MLILNRLRSGIRIWNGKRRTLVELRWKRWVPRLVIHEKYEKRTKWFLRGLTGIGVVSSIGIFQVWWVSLTVAILLVSIEQFVERAVVLYTIIYWQPMPNFKWKIGEEWTGMGYAFPEPKGPRDLNVAGPVFRSEGCAREFFALLRKWNYGGDDDEENNICMSLISVEKGGYYAFIYPNLGRQIIKETLSGIRDSQKLERYGKEASELVVQSIFCRHLSYGRNSLFERFSREQSGGQPYWLKPFIQKPDGSTQIMFSENSILKRHLKIKPRKELVESEPEYQHFIHVIDVRREWTE